MSNLWAKMNPLKSYDFAKTTTTKKALKRLEDCKRYDVDRLTADLN